MKLLLFPFKLAMFIVESVFRLTGKLITIALGFTISAIGVILSLTIVGAIIGIPLLILGVLMIIKGIF